MTRNQTAFHPTIQTKCGARITSFHQSLRVTSSHPSTHLLLKPNMDSPPNPFATSPSSSTSALPPLPPSSSTSPNPQSQAHPRAPSSTFSAASGSPPPTHRASFPDPSKEPRGAALGDRLVGPKAKEGFCCDRDREIHKGEEISIVDAFKTTEGGKASYITYVIRLGVSVSVGIQM